MRATHTPPRSPRPALAFALPPLLLLLLLAAGLAGPIGCKSTAPLDTQRQGEPSSAEPRDPAAQPGEPGPPPAYPTVRDLAGVSVPVFDAAAADDDRATVVVFMTLWCAICRAEQPEVVAWAEAHAAEAKLVYVCIGSAPDAVRGDLAARGWDLEALPYRVDTEGRFGQAFEVVRTPTIVLLDPDGRHRGTFRTLADLPADLTTRLAAPPPPASDNDTPAGPTADAPPANAAVTPVGDDAAIATRPTHAVVSDSGDELGTTYAVVIYVPSADDDARQRAQAALIEARARLEPLARRFSEWREDSEISRVNRDAAAAAPVPISHDMALLLAGALHVARATDGAFDPTFAPLASVWQEADARGTLPTGAEMDRALAAVSWRHVELENDTVRLAHPRARLGIAGVAKGWIIDDLFHFLTRDRGFIHVTVNIGGDIRTSGVPGPRPNLMLITDPYDDPTADTAGRALVADAIRGGIVIPAGAIATSGNYHRFRTIAGRQIGHILDPRTGYPPTFDGSVTVLTRDAAMADALATALFVMGPEDGLAFARATAGLDAIYITREGIRATIPIESAASASPSPDERASHENALP